MMSKRISVLILLIFTMLSVIAQENNCTDGIDNDADGLIDLQDIADCPCDFSTQIGMVTSLIPNPSFETFNICPSVPQQMNEATSWNQMTNAGPDYFNTCHPFANIAPMPLPDGNGVAGFAASNGFLEFIGAELTTPLTAGEDYRLDFNMAAAHLDGTIQNSVGPPLVSSINITLYGNLSNANFPIATTTGIVPPAPASTWEVIGFVSYSPNAFWTDESMLFTANDNYSMIAFGPPTALPFDYINANDLPYFFVDNMILNLEASFGTALSLTGELCLDNSMISSTVPDPTTQWYFNGVSIPLQTTDDIDVSNLGLGAGNYTLAIFPLTGCVFTFLDVLDNDYPTLTYTLSDLCPPDDVTFTSTSVIASGTIDSTNWSFSVNNYPTDVATENFPTPGNFNVTISAFSDIGCQSDSSFSIAIEGPPVASFGYTPDCFNLPLSFTDLSVPGVNGSGLAGFIWDFGGTGMSILQDPTHQFPDTLDYDVTLTISTANGCSDDTTITVTTFAHPVAHFSNSPACEDQGPVEFFDESTISLGNIAFIGWDYGDTNTEGNITNPTHDYAVGGDYNVTITATSDEGCFDTFTEIVTVSEVTANFNADDFAGCSPHCVQFSEFSSTNSGNIVQWNWEFSNGASSSLQNPAVCFSNPSHRVDSLYDVQLVATNDLGCTDTLLAVGAIVSAHIPVADFSYLPNEITSIYPVVAFSNLSDGGSNFTWDLGGEFISNEQDPVFEFEAVGLIAVTLVTATPSCSDTISKIIRISPDETIYVPGAFTPDEDGLNELFFPVIEGSPIINFYEFILYDRLGHIVYETSDPLEKWNGSFKGYTENYTTDGLYTWLMRIKFDGSTDTVLKTGTLKIFR
ncbi:MAG: PKD repeat protein [Patiriisocius sp.]|jgi:PKD repeat protein